MFTSLLRLNALFLFSLFILFFFLKEMTEQVEIEAETGYPEGLFYFFVCFI